jgi:proline racemase
MHERVKVSTSAGTINVAISFGGAIYAQVTASDLGLTVSAEDLPRIISFSREIRPISTMAPAQCTLPTHGSTASTA